MANKIIKAQMQQRRDTKANWAAQNPVLLEGELGIVSDDPNLYKVGDGTTAWNALPFRGFDGTLVHTTGDSETSVMSQKSVTTELAKLAENQGDVSVPFSFPGKRLRNGREDQSSAYYCTDYLPIYMGSSFLVYDSPTYDVAGITFFDRDHSFISVLELGESSGAKKVKLTPDNVPQDAEYCIACALTSSEHYANLSIPEILIRQLPLTSLKNSPVAIAREVNGAISTAVALSKRGNINVYIDDTPKQERYFITVESSAPPADTFDLYFTTTAHGTDILYKSNARWGEYIEIIRNEEFPTLGILKVNAPANNATYKISFYEPTSLKRVSKSVSGWSGKTIVSFGDSLTEKTGSNNKGYCEYLAEFTGARVYNIGIGGAQLKQRTTPVSTPTSSHEAYAALDVINLVKACCDQDFSKQEAASVYLKNNASDDNTKIIDRAKSIEWSKVDAVTIFAGINDWAGEEKRGEAGSEDINTTLGAVTAIIKTLLTTYPHIKLYWLTPIVRWASPRSEASWSDNEVIGGVTLKELSEKIAQVAKSHHIPVCDMYNSLGWNMFNFSAYFGEGDGTHPTNYEPIAKKIIGFINANRTF